MCVCVEAVGGGGGGERLLYISPQSTRSLNSQSVLGPLGELSVAPSHTEDSDIFMPAGNLSFDVPTPACLSRTGYVYDLSKEVKAPLLSLISLTLIWAHK